MFAGASIPPNANDANSPLTPRLSLPRLFPSIPSLFPFPNTPFTSSLFPLLPLSPVAKRPPEIGKGYGERFSSELPQRGPGGVPAANAFWVNLGPRKRI